MTKTILRHRLLLSFAVFALMAVPGVCTTITVSSSVAPNPILLPDQTLNYLGNNNQNVTVGPGTFDLGSFQSTITTNTTLTPSFILTITDSVDAVPLAFAGSISTTGGVDTFSFTGTGTETINGVTYATLTDAGFIYGVQQTFTVTVGKGTPVVSSIVSATPEPSAFFLSGFGLIALAGVLRNRRKGL